MGTYHLKDKTQRARRTQRVFFFANLANFALNGHDVMDAQEPPKIERRVRRVRRAQFVFLGGLGALCVPIPPETPTSYKNPRSGSAESTRSRDRRKPRRCGSAPTCRSPKCWRSRPAATCS